METIELQNVGPDEWEAVLDGETQAWGAAGDEFSWADKERHVAVCDEAGQPVALAGAMIAQVTAGGEAFPVVGIGGVVVTRTLRGRGLARRVIEAIMGIAAELEPERAMLFCGEELTTLYARFDFRTIEASVSAEQPSGRVVMPMRAMWAPLVDGIGWPVGDVAVQGLPF
ncbi:MAG TPA: GNAT family N-acetyltransferase [Solirubrobacteraceae bacterium]|nr:GNAT family N-acetyltransferase [Solirubrobacteraceae bacterium]